MADLNLRPPLFCIRRHALPHLLTKLLPTKLISDRSHA